MAAMSTQLRSLVLAEAERARSAVEADCAAISRWERDTDVMRTLVNVGAPGDPLRFRWRRARWAIAALRSGAIGGHFAPPQPSPASAGESALRGRVFKR